MTERYLFYKERDTNKIESILENTYPRYELEIDP